MKKAKKKIDWTKIEQQVSDLRHRNISPEQRIKEARSLSEIYKTANRFLPSYLAALI